MKVKIEIDTMTFVRFWLVVIGFALVALAIYSAKTALIIIGSALFLALALNAPVSWLARHLPGKSRVGGTALAYVVVVILIGAFVTLVVPPVVQQTAKFIQTVPSIVDGATKQYRGVSHVIDKYHLQPQVDQGLDSIKKNASGWAADLGSNVIGRLGSLIGFVVSLILVLVLSFLMLIEGPQLLRKLWGLYDDQEQMESHRNLAGRMYNVVTGYVVGQLTVSAIGATVMGIFVFILSFIFDIPGNLAIPTAAIYFILSLIPMFGSSIAAVLIGLLLLLNDPTAAVVFLIGFFIYQQVENNFISPTIQSKKMELTALWILMAVTIGLYVFGIAGGIISIPIAGCLRVLLDDYLARAKKKRQQNKTPLGRLAKKAKA